jgi:hypothetical protein
MSENKTNCMKYCIQWLDCVDKDNNFKKKTFWELFKVTPVDINPNIADNKKLYYNKLNNNNNCQEIFDNWVNCHNSKQK